MSAADSRAREPRVFLRGIESRDYSLQAFRQAQLAASRVRHSGHIRPSDPSDKTAGESPWSLAPEDDPFLTQTIQVHFVELPPAGSNKGHGHQNEAMFYVLSGEGYDIHDGARYDWETGDVIVVHTDSVHRHFNGRDNEPAAFVVFKAKAMWMYFGLVHQGKIGTSAGEGFGSRQDWAQLWTRGVLQRKKVVRGSETPWELTPRGKVKQLMSSGRDDVRLFSIEVELQEIEPGGSSSRRWQMADEVGYIVSGKGASLQWEVRADIDDKYYARIAEQPTRWDCHPGDTVYIPQNTVAQYLNTGRDPLIVLRGQNRLFRALGYDNEVRLEPATAGHNERSQASAV